MCNKPQETLLFLPCFTRSRISNIKNEMQRLSPDYSENKLKLRFLWFANAHPGIKIDG